MRSWWWCDCTETCRSCFNVHFNIVLWDNSLVHQLVNKKTLIISRCTARMWKSNSVWNRRTLHHKLPVCYVRCVKVKAHLLKVLSYSRPGRSRNVLPVGARSSPLAQTGPGARPASYAVGTSSFPGIKRPEHCLHHPPPSSAQVKERVKLYASPPFGAFMAGYNINFILTFSVTQLLQGMLRGLEGLYGAVCSFQWKISLKGIVYSYSNLFNTTFPWKLILSFNSHTSNTHKKTYFFCLWRFKFSWLDCV
jgi:hypothetical protein